MLDNPSKRFDQYTTWTSEAEELTSLICLMVLRMRNCQLHSILQTVYCSRVYLEDTLFVFLYLSGL